MPSASRNVRWEQRRFLSSSLSLCVSLSICYLYPPRADAMQTLISPSRFFPWFHSTVWYLLFDRCPRVYSTGVIFQEGKKKRRVNFLGAISTASQTLVQLCTRSNGHDFLLAKVSGARRKSCSSSSSSTHQSVLVQIFMTKFSPSFRVIDWWWTFTSRPESLTSSLHRWVAIRSGHIKGERAHQSGGRPEKTRQIICLVPTPKLWSKGPSWLLLRLYVYSLGFCKWRCRLAFDVRSLGISVD
jgi:hypothetical protein